MLASECHYQKERKKRMDVSEKRDALWVRQKNEIIQRSGNVLTALQNKALLYCISQVDTVNDEPDTLYTISTLELCRVCGLTNDWYNKTIKDIFTKLLSPLAFIRGNDGKYRPLVWISPDDFVLDTANNTVTFKFTKQVSFFLYKLKVKYTEFKLINGVVLKSKYAISLYQLLKSYERMESHRASFELEQLKKALGVIYEKNLCTVPPEEQEWIDIYPRYYDFEKRALKPAIDEINKVCDITVSYEVGERTSRNKPKNIIFTILPKNPFEDPEGVRRMKEEQNRRLNAETKK